MTDSYSTFIIGGTFRTKEEKVLVQKRSWEMLRIFGDQMASPIFGMLQVQDDETLEYPLPESVRVVRIPNVHGKNKLINTALGKALTPEIRATIDNCCAVYLRQPVWECWDVFKYARSRKKKIIVSYHGDWPDALRKSEATGARHLFSLVLAQYIHHVFKVMARYSEISFCVGKELQDTYGVLAKRSVVFANFLHSAADIAEPRPLNKTPPYGILFVGHFEEYKGTKYLIRAAALLKKQGLDFKLMIVGTGSLEQDLRALVLSEGIEENVEWLGYVQHGRELMEVYRQADLFVLPSIASEGTAKVLMEAMSQGVPVIATDVGSSRHLLSNGRYGAIVHPADACELASVIRDMLANVELRRSLVEKGLELARVSTREKQEEIVRCALETTIPEIVGIPKGRSQ